MTRKQVKPEWLPLDCVAQFVYNELYVVTKRGLHDMEQQHSPEAQTVHSVSTVSGWALKTGVRHLSTHNNPRVPHI